jgi:hypothetical protein
MLTSSSLDLFLTSVSKMSSTEVSSSVWPASSPFFAFAGSNSCDRCESKSQMNCCSMGLALAGQAFSQEE